MIQQNQQTNKIMSWVMSINAATVHLSVTKSMKQRTGWFNNNFPSTSSHTSCFRLFFSAYYLRVQSCWTSGVKGCLSKTTKKNYINDQNRNHGFENIFPGLESFLLENRGPIFHWTKKPSFHHQKIHWNQSKVHPWKSENNMLYKKNWWLKPNDTFFCGNVFNIFPAFTKRCFNHPIWTKHASSSRANLPQPSFGDVKKTQKHWENPTCCWLIPLHLRPFTVDQANRSNWDHFPKELFETELWHYLILVGWRTGSL